MAQITETTLIKQYEEMKKKHPDAILLFRVGDFYETFKDDAKTTSDICGLTLTTRSNGADGEKIYLAGFPHDALDTYLPKLTRAGKRVCILKQKEDGNKHEIVEVMTPGAQSSEPTEPNHEEQKKESKPTAQAVKEINCTRTTEQMRELGEPVAYFQMNVPKEAKGLGKYTSKEANRPMLQNVLVEPDAGKMIACDTHILYVVDVDCDGIWPTAENKDKPFRCYIDSKSISALAGKTVDVAVWKNGSAIVTGCEADGVRTQNDFTGNYPNWKRVMPKETPAMIALQSDELKPLRDFMKGNMGKTKKERESRSVAIMTDRATDTMKVEITENRYSYNSTLIAEGSFRLVDRCDWYIRMIYRADLFYYSIQEDFGGVICLVTESSPTKFLGEQRESLLMPIRPEEEKESYVTDDYDKTK